MPKLPNKSISFITAAIGSVITSNIFLQKTILFFNSTSFGNGKTDLVFGHDIGYYLFIKPFLQAVLIYMLVTFAISTIYAAIYYIISLNTQFTNGVTTESLKNSIIKQQLLNNAKIIVITDGGNGAYAYDGEYLYKCPQFPAKVVSTLGAGDAFASTFVTVLDKSGWNIEKSLICASINAASVVEQFNAQDGQLKYDEVIKIKEENKGSTCI